MRRPLLLVLGSAGLLLFACGSEVTSGEATFANDAGGDGAGGGSSGGSSGSSSGGSSSGGEDGGDAGATDAGGGDGDSLPPYAVVWSGPDPYAIGSRTPVAATFAVNGALDSFTYSAAEAPERKTAGVYDVLKDALSGTGRWSNGNTGGTFDGNTGILLSPTQGFHYGFIVRPAAAPAATAGTYALAGVTQPTIDDGTVPIGTMTGTVATAIDGANMRVGIQLSIAMPTDATYTVTTTGGSAVPATSAIVASGTELGFGGDATATSVGAACQGGGACTATIKAMRAAGNDRIVIAYAVTAGAAGKTLRGAAVFAKQ